MNAYRFLGAALPACLTTLPALAAAATQTPVAPANVMILGSFHLKSGQGVVKVKFSDVMSKIIKDVGAYLAHKQI